MPAYSKLLRNATTANHASAQIDSYPQGVHGST